jgi:hypothetical protein
MVLVVVAGTHDEERKSNAGRSMLLVGPGYPTSISLISPHEFQTSDMGSHVFPVHGSTQLSDSR